MEIGVLGCSNASSRTFGTSSRNGGTFLISVSPLLCFSWCLNPQPDTLLLP
ncbi:hypothetical protein LINPERPRIM_LOCUS3155 [Linum perenne]